MASIIGFHLDRFSCATNFPIGIAPRLIDYWQPGPVQFFSREEVPRRAFLVSDRKTVTEFISIRGKLGVCPEARDLIETLEPGRHQFFEVEIARDRGKRPIWRLDGRILDTPYYLLNPGVRLDAVLIEKSNVEIKEFKTMTLVFPYPTLKEQVVLRRSVVEGHHVWKGQYQLGMIRFFLTRLPQRSSRGSGKA